MYRPIAYRLADAPVHNLTVCTEVKKTVGYSSPTPTPSGNSITDNLCPHSTAFSARTLCRCQIW